MSQSFRRTLVWTIIAIILMLAAMLQLKAAPAVSSTDKAAKEKSQQALVQAFGCTISVLTFHLPEAEGMCGRTIELFPDNPLGYKFRGLTYLLEHRFERSESDFREAVKLDPRDPDSEAGLGQALNGQGRFDEAIGRFTAALAMRPLDARYLSARCWARAGQGSDFPKALTDCNRAIQLSPHTAVAYNARGLIYLKKNQYTRAVRDYATSLQLDKNQASALFGRGFAEWHLGQRVAARSDISQARRIDPDIDSLYVMVGVLEEDCRIGGGACSLPHALRPAPEKFSPLYRSVSYPH